jgi:hypothetical protein
MQNRKFWLLAILILVVIIICLMGLQPVETILINFPEILLGQVSLSRETKPLYPRAFASEDFLLNRVNPSEIEKAEYIALREDALFWESDYVGFARTVLSHKEIVTLQQILSSGKLFHRSADGDSYMCVTRNASHIPALEPCAQGKQYLDRFMAYQQEAQEKGAVGVLQFTLSDGRLAEIRVFPAEQGVAYTPYEKNGDWWIDGISPPLSLINELSTRTMLAPIPVLWPELSAGRANARAARMLGHRYNSSLVVVQESIVVREVFGEILEIRPALGTNNYSSWMDSTSLFLTLRVQGTRGQGAVIIQGDDCFDLEIVFEGVLVEDGSGYICPQNAQNGRGRWGFL